MSETRYIEKEIRQVGVDRLGMPMFKVSLKTDGFVPIPMKELCEIVLLICECEDKRYDFPNALGGDMFFRMLMQARMLVKMGVQIPEACTQAYNYASKLRKKQRQGGESSNG